MDLTSRERELVAAVRETIEDRLGELKRGGAQLYYLTRNVDGSVGPDHIEPVSKAEMTALEKRLAALENKVAELERRKAFT